MSEDKEKKSEDWFGCERVAAILASEQTFSDFCEFYNLSPERNLSAEFYARYRELDRVSKGPWSLNLGSFL